MSEQSFPKNTDVREMVFYPLYELIDILKNATDLEERRSKMLELLTELEYICVLEA